MLIFEGYSEDRWTDFNAQYLKMRVWKAGNFKSGTGMDGSE